MSSEQQKEEDNNSSAEPQIRQKHAVPAFLIKTYEILENPTLQHILCWSPSGQGFIVKDQEQLCNNILPTFFKHKNYPSFLRQLNMYNFKKTRTDGGETEFSHKWFRRGGKGLLCHIRRRNQEDEEEGVNPSVKNLDEIEMFRKQQKELKQEILQITEMQGKLQQALTMILQQNDTLQNESINLQKEILNIQKRNQQRFDNYSMILSEIISKLQQEQHFTEIRRPGLESQNILQMLAKDKRDHEIGLPDVMRMQANLQVPMQLQQMMNMYPKQPQPTQQQLSLTYMQNSPFLNMGLGAQPPINGMNNMSGVNMSVLNVSPSANMMLQMSPYHLHSPYANGSMPPSPHHEIKRESDNFDK